MGEDGGLKGPENEPVGMGGLSEVGARSLLPTQNIFSVCLMYTELSEHAIIMKIKGR